MFIQDVSSTAMINRVPNVGKIAHQLGNVTLSLRKTIDAQIKTNPIDPIKLQKIIF